MVREQLGAQTNWSDSDDLAMLFQGTYRSSFYRKLHRLLHDDLDVRRKLREPRTCVFQEPADGAAVLGSQFSVLAQLDRLNAEWFELGRMELRERNDTPTLLVRQHSRVEAPDLSKEWN
jgi:hypothetical protein